MQQTRSRAVSSGDGICIPAARRSPHRNRSALGGELASLAIVAPDLDVAVVGSAPLIECFENTDPVPIEMKSPNKKSLIV
jgi:hypothetical protein